MRAGRSSLTRCATQTRPSCARALFIAPLVWVALEWARLGATGQLWNAIGYSQAYQPALIQTARWGGVYAVGFLILLTNAAIAFLLQRRTMRAVLLVVVVIAAVGFGIKAPRMLDAVRRHTLIHRLPAAVIVAVQPNVPVSFDRSLEETEALIARHVSLSADALRKRDEPLERELREEITTGDNPMPTLESLTTPRVVVWPESPMNFSYADDEEFRAFVGEFAREQRAAVLFNSLEPAPAGGAYNSAVLVNEEGRLVAQYDKIRLLPFGEYVPLPSWFPGTWLLRGLVGDFTPGTKYPLLPLGTT
ncbi:MAG TPA: apolipoprotein N-acyltransferase, partial [Pyrinomonadaceae bacterium]|nr:apolipoprotein N-acyltransferase [Pyrinomonadaceae bacterium]